MSFELATMPDPRLKRAEASVEGTIGVTAQVFNTLAKAFSRLVGETQQAVEHGRHRRRRGRRRGHKSQKRGCGCKQCCCHCRDNVTRDKVYHQPKLVESQKGQAHA